MSEVRPLHPLKGNQSRASDPERHVWLSASAGTGKTQVLAARVWRLLLNGTDPGAILCLTFTKAGAAEMSERITSRLARWVRSDEGSLRADLAALGETATPQMIGKARQLFAKVLDAPGGGIRIQTIHSFCQSLLAAFPMEAGLVPGFRPLDQREEAVLAREALAEMLVDAEREGRGWIVDAVGALSLRLGEGKAEDFLKACAREGEALAELPILVQPFLREALGLPEGDVDAEIARRCADDAFDLGSLRALTVMNADWDTARGRERADIAAAWLSGSPEARAAGLADLHSIWATAKGEPRSFGKGQAPQDPAYADYAMRLYETCTELLGMKTQAAYADLLASGLEAGRVYAETYARAKRRLGAVDFNDLIHRTVALLAEPGMGEWVRFKLDTATEHVLIDEAQDTNPQQWAIVSAIADEFFVGEGARAETVRTLFTVGDYKQAIFGFQGTDPIFFRAAFERFLARSRIHPDPGFEVEPREVEELSLTHSFRSTRPVLEFVDAAIGALPGPGMGELSDAEPHASEVPGPGTVTLWPPVTEGGSEADEEEWVSDATRELARRIARAIKGWIGNLDLESKGRKLAPEDVMILVKRRGELASLIVARLYAEGVPVAGVDRLRLNAPLAVQDLLAAIRFALQPEDDLSLASLLVSPLIGWTQEELMDAAVRKGGGLWRHLRKTQPEERLAPLYALLARADIATPYRFLEELLSGPLDGRRKLLRRLGEEARDPIEELLNATLNFEKVATPSLQRFLDWFDRGDVEIVRDAAQPQAAVRVMTAHGAKGLQAPLVVLADATVDPTRSPRDFLHWEPSAASGKLPIFRPRAAERGVLGQVLENADARELSEHWRLFYVAATRAEERLVIAGALGPQAKGVPPQKSWYAASAAALDALGVAEGEVREFKGLQPQAPVPARSRPASEPAEAAALPGWARRPAPEEARPPRPLAPSALGDDAVADPPPTPALRAAAERGRLLHSLFERLPSVSPAERAAAAERWLAGAGGVGDPARRAELVAAALAVTEDPRFAELFGPMSLGEAPIAAVVGDGLVVSGTVDRLVVTPGHARVVDFKTGRRAPASLAEIPPYHLRQMAAYAAALAVIFPGRVIEAGLLYAAGPVLHLLPADLLLAHKPGFTDMEQSLGLRA
ncbi:double-strand break repair helicase AddA [Sphingomonas sp. NPDC092331]|uniref:double-strand break repair helicase AddA n=1 Tax=unclassified Sphingomonas TaxID=196159 RepID=UPI0029EFA153|nr:double-strand break repair helicase AddA [Pseudomonadota bacterium]